MYMIYQKVPTARVLASPSGTAKEDNTQRECYFVKTLTNNGARMAKMLRYGRTDGHMDRETCQLNVKVEILIDSDEIVNIPFQVFHSSY